MMRPKLLLLFLFIWTVPSFGQQYNFIKYSIAEGLPQSQVYASFQDSRGYIWFGTQGGGLSRFDGNEFENYSTKDGLPSNYVNAIFEDNQKQLWIGTQKGIGIFNNGNFNEIKSINQPIEAVRAICNRTDSTVWMGSGRGIYEYNINSKKVRKVDVQRRLNSALINDFFQGKNGLWVASNRGAWHIGEKVSNFNLSNGLAGDEVHDFTMDINGHIWVATFGDGLTIIDEQNLQVLGYEKNSKIERALCNFTDDEGNIWVGTLDKGISIYSPTDSTWTTIDESKNLPNNHVRNIIKDQWKNIWISTSGGGVTKYLGQYFSHFTESDGLSGNRIYALHQDSQDRIWASASSNGIAILDSLGFQHFAQDSGYIDVKCKAIFEDSKNRIWIGTEGAGLAVYDTLGFRIITKEDGLPSNWIRNFAEDTLGNIWVATHANGLALVEEIDSINFMVGSFLDNAILPDLYISTLKRGTDDNIWFATNRGKIGCIKNGQLSKVYGKAEGLPQTAIRCISFDSLGNIWAGTSGDGIFVANIKDGGNFKPIESEKDLFSLNIYLLIFDNNDNLWAGSENGIDKIIINKAGVVTDIQHFGRNEGFIGIETCQNSAIADKDGSLWFGTMNGLTRHFPSERPSETGLPLIHFSNISLFYQPMSKTTYSDWLLPSGGIKKGLKLPHSKNHLSFDFKAVNINNPKRTKYRWRLNGNEENGWSPLSHNESVNYSSLPPGNYKFEVQACSDNKRLSEPISASFSIKEPFWQTTWFKLLAAAILGLLIFGIYKNRVANIRKKEAVKREQLEVENKLLQLEQKALQLQMNPHFIFNALNSIQSLVATKDYLTARREINNFAQLMRSILNNSRQQKIALNEEIQTLEQYLKMEQFCQQQKFNYEIIPPQNMDSEEIDIPPMLIQPYVENSIIHGLSHLDKPGTIKIEFSTDNDLLICEVTDNGIGRKKAEAMKESKKPGHQSTAMAVTKERLNALKKEGNYKALHISDVLNTDNSIGGTKVKIKIPLDVNF